MENKSISVPFVVRDLICKHGSVYNYFPRGTHWKVVTSKLRGCSKKDVPDYYEDYFPDEKVQEDYRYFTSHWKSYDVHEEI